MSLRAVLAGVAVWLAAGVHAQTPDSTASRPDSVRVTGGRTVPLDSLRSGPAPAGRTVPIAAPLDRREPLPARSMLVGNVVAQAALTAGRGLAEGGRVGQTPAFVLGGAVAGAGFYGAKRLVGERRPVLGFALAYASASLAENVAEGRHALSHVRVGLGPLDVRVATPFARDDGPGVRLEAEPISVVAAVVLPLQGFRVRGCAAGLCYRGEDAVRITRAGRRYRRLGRTVGRVVRVWPPFTARTEAHEGVHVIQGMQLAAATPRGTLRALVGDRTEAAVALDVRTDWLTPVIGGLVFSLVEYERVWTEREAFTLAGQDGAPIAPRP